MPGAGRGAPPLEHLARDVLAAAHGEQRRPLAPPAPLSAEEQALADEAARNLAGICKYCIGLHPLPTTIGCPRIASAELDGDGRIKSMTFWPGKAWAKGRLVFFEDTKEKKKDGDGVN